MKPPPMLIPPSLVSARARRQWAAGLAANLIAVSGLLLSALPVEAQLGGGGQSSTPSTPSIQLTPPSGPTAPSSNNYQGSVTQGVATADTLSLTLDDAVQRGVKANLGQLLANTQTESA
ncbi:MAG TPA: hypothetical protein VIM62_11510, partial [Acidobacteriaceae bacterium]